MDSFGRTKQLPSGSRLAIPANCSHLTVRGISVPLCVKLLFDNIVVMNGRGIWVGGANKNDESAYACTY